MNKLNALVKSNNGVALGQGLLLENLVKSHGFGPYLTGKAVWVKKLETLLEDEVYILGTIVKQLTSEVSLPVKMKLFILKELGSTKFDEIVKKWISLSNQFLIQPAVNFATIDNHLLFASGWLDSQPFLKDVVGACYKAQTHSSLIRIPNIYRIPPQPPTFIKKTVTHFGAAVHSWINESYGPKRLGLSTGQQPNNITTQEGPTSGTCFLPCTEVMLDNHRSITIEHLKENDKILGGHGNIGVISSEKVVQVLEDHTRIFGFNEDKPFFLASHPFWTQDGWRAVDPHTAREENAWLDVGQLSEGDFVRRISNIQGNEIHYQWVEVTSIHSQVFPSGTKVYGVHTREGPRSYHANGYLVLENYPEITAQSTADGLNNLSFEEQKKLQETFDELDPILTKAYGPAVAKAMRSMSERHHSSKQENPSRNESKRVPLKDVSLPHLALHYQAGKTKSDSYEMPSKISLMRGHLFINDQHVQDTKINSDDNISWTRPVPGGKWEHGSMKLYHGRLQGHGFVSLTQNHSDTVSLASANFIAAAHLNTYKCYHSAQPLQKGKEVGGWQDLGALQMGVDCSSGICREVGKIKIPPMDEFDTLENHVVFTVDSKQQLSVHVVVPVGYQETLKYTKLAGVFSADFSSFTGECTAYDGTKPGFEGLKYGWKGTIEHNVTSMAMLNKARNESLKSKIHTQKDVTHSIPSVQATDAVDAPQLSAMAGTLSLMATQNLSVNELYLMTPPDSKAMHEQTFSKLQQAMKYEMNSSDRENILGVNRPTISGDFAAVADKYKTFLGNHFANAYMMNGLAQSTHYKDKITQDEKNKMLYYFSGNAKGCLAQDKDYNNVNNEVSRIAYLELQTDLDKYVQSTQGGPYWATQLFNRLNEQQVLNGLALQATISETTKIINKQTMVLYCLDPSKDYGAQFYKKILMTRLNITRSYFNGSTDKHAAEMMKTVFSDIMHQLIVKILAGGDKTTSEIMKELNKQIGEAAKEMNVDITKNAEESASDMMAHFETAISEIITLYNLKQNSSWNRLVESVNATLKKSKFLFYTSKVFSFLVCQALWAASFYFTIETFMNWKNLSKEKKVSLIIDVVNMSVDMIAKFPAMVKNFQEACAAGKTGWKWIKAKVQADADPAIVDEINGAIDNEIHEVNGKYR